jgi:HAD superfamily hydrolase (TIGR01490 family)
MAQRPIAAFDLDGTLIRWQLYHAVADKLARDGHINQEAFKRVKMARMEWKNRVNDMSFKTYEQALVYLVDTAITKISVADFDIAVKEVIDEYKNQTYTYTRNLLSELKSKNYLLFAISASQEQLVKMIAETYGFDDYAGSTYEVKNGYFTGEKHVIKGDEKPSVLKKLVKKHHATWKASIAVGDSESDIPMLDAVENPIAMNPTKELFEQAKANNWRVVIERKNVIYTLEPHNGSYLLAQTDT